MDDVIGVVSPSGVTPPTPGLTASVPADELVDLCAFDTELYCHTFFPSAFRQASPAFHREIDDLLEDRSHRYVAIESFRGSAKTTKLRAYISKRIAYGTSRTILVVSETQTRSMETIDWIRNKVEHSSLWTSIYGLEKGKKWNSEKCEVVHRLFGHTVTLLAVGITGQIRGVNIEDYRPDLIVVDDPCDEENTLNPDQRDKIEKLFFGALEKTLAPRSECPDAKMVLLQTSLQEEDLINKCHKNPQWFTRKFSCFTPEGESAWPQRWTKEELLGAKQAHVDQNLLMLWMREMECTIIGAELADFKAEWVQYWDVLPSGMMIHLGLDPVPPPTSQEALKNLYRKDFEALSVVGFKGPDVYLLETSQSRGHQPDWTINEFFRLVDKWRPMKARVESIAYQATLKWILEQEMAKRRRWIQIDAVPDKRKKRHRILGALSGISSAKRFFLPRSEQTFATQYLSYPNCSYYDLLDATAMAVDSGMGLAIAVDGSDELGFSFDETPLGVWRQAP